MNFKERGITVGDILIFIVIILAATTLIKTFKKEKKPTFNLNNQEQLSFKTISLSKNQFNQYLI
tara:strand:+ start:332 stop:523 length:192 start_codon:yes stop_codon:yes gene_type:complete